jgi:biotin operon repressor
MKSIKGSAILFSLTVLLFYGLITCAKKSEVRMVEKFDARLRIAINAQRSKNDSTPLGCLVKLSKQPQEKDIEQLKKCGLQIITVVHDIVTAEGTPDALDCAANLKFVKSVSKSQMDNPMK